MNPLWDKTMNLCTQTELRIDFKTPESKEQLNKSEAHCSLYFILLVLNLNGVLELIQTVSIQIVNCPVKLNHPNVMESQSQIVIRNARTNSGHDSTNQRVLKLLSVVIQGHLKTR